MGRLRRDETTEEWVILAPERLRRKAPPRHEERPAAPAFEPECPFCPGNEDRTPPEVFRVPQGAVWERRVIPNMFPALSPGGSTERTDEVPTEMDGVGAHEVIIESRLHNERLDEMDLEHLTTLLRLWRDRARARSVEPWARCVTLFRNFGARAGTSLDHPHSQMIVTPVVPPEIRRRTEVAERYWDEHGRSVYVDIVGRELDRGERVIAVRDDFVSLAPFASQVPFETWILPREEQPSFNLVGDGQLPSLAAILRDVLRGLRDSADDPDHNLAIRSAAVGEESHRSFGWHLAIFPRTTIPAGFELGSGMSINPVLPERAAEWMRASLAALAHR